MTTTTKYDIRHSDFNRIDNDINGNPRYVIHFLKLLTDDERNELNMHSRYNYVVKKANKVGGRKYHTKSYGGGIVFQSNNLEETIKYIQTI